MSVITPGRNIVLAGMMGSGKSTVGRMVAKMLSRPFVDTDKVVEDATGKTVAEIFATEGERAFRDHERAAVRRVAATRGQVISLGGGVVMDPANVTQLRGTGDIVWIDAPISALAMRLSGSTKPNKRPLLEGERDHDALVTKLTKMRAERFDAYAASAAYVLDTMGRPSEAVAQEVFAWAMEHPGLLAVEERA